MIISFGNAVVSPKTVNDWQVAQLLQKIHIIQFLSSLVKTGLGSFISHDYIERK